MRWVLGTSGPCLPPGLSLRLRRAGGLQPPSALLLRGGSEGKGHGCSAVGGETGRKKLSET